MRRLATFWPWRSAKESLSWEPTQQDLLITFGKKSTLPYILPTEKDLSGERGRLDFQHHALRQLLQGNYLAPIDPSLQNIVDIGYGTGKWVREMAVAFPHAKVIGVDIQATPRLETDPQNCSLTQANILHGLPIPSHSADLTHQRLLVGAIPATHWPAHIAELVRITAEDGWIDILEAGGEYIGINPALEQLQHWWKSAAPKVGIDLSLIPRLGELLIEQGMINVQVRSLPLPLGKWGGRAGEMLAMDLESVSKQLKPFYRTYAHVSDAAYDRVIQQLRSEWGMYHTQQVFYSIIGQKPVERR